MDDLRLLEVPEHYREVFRCDQFGGTLLSSALPAAVVHGDACTRGC